MLEEARREVSHTMPGRTLCHTYTGVVPSLPIPLAVPGTPLLAGPAALRDVLPSSPLIHKVDGSLV